MEISDANKNWIILSIHKSLLNEFKLKKILKYLI